MSVLVATEPKITGALDLGKGCGALVIAGALPYTTAVKGHVAIEYFFHKLGRRGRIVVDTLGDELHFEREEVEPEETEDAEEPQKEPSHAKS